MVYELMSFVTPYGINLDLGIEGKTWSFDVTEFGPLLKGEKRIYLNRGGQWQEDMDIRFEFVEGTPVRDIVNIRQLWPVTSQGYQQILNNTRFEPREIEFDSDMKMAEIKSVITGHGQEGEFIPEIVNPSTEVIHERFNPACQAPVIKIRNNGTEPLTQLSIEYGFDDDGNVLEEDSQTFTWFGNLEFLEEEEIELPFFPGLTLPEGARFRVTLADGDQDNDNNTLASAIRTVDHFDADLEIQFKTNFVPSETSYTVYDENGNVVLQKLSAGLSGNTIYRDTLTNINGCYRLEINDTGEDGLSWWANNDGDGYIALKPIGGSWNTLPTDFGSIYRYDFTAGIVVSTEEVLADEVITIYPNPVSKGLYVDVDERLANGKVVITNEIGQQVHSESIAGRSELKVLDDIIRKVRPR